MDPLWIVAPATGLVALSMTAVVWASPDAVGPCSERLQRLGYSQVALESRQAHSSLYEAHRAQEEVNVMVQNGTCTVQRVWIDD